jgi:murein DD-endopeptidase MepM/ murein hydrolase activator NlpD
VIALLLSLVLLWTRPVDGPVVKPFVAPVTRFGPGHRGVDFKAKPGTPVRAAGPGIVVFAGTIAHQRYVVILHRGNLRTSYSYLRSIKVRRGQRVREGQVIATTGRTVLHFGARRGPAYFDPMTLFATGPPDLPSIVHLAPLSYHHAQFTVS